MLNAVLAILTLAPKPPQDFAQQRAVFGERFDGVKAKERGVYNVWNTHVMFGEFKTEAYFPAGKGNERYYLNRWIPYIAPVPNRVNRVSNQYVFSLALETKRGKSISFDWSTRLRSTTPQSNLKGGDVWHGRQVGTLEAMLLRRGLEIASRPRGSAASSFERLDGYAVYSIVPETGSLSFWFVRPTGIRTAGQALDYLTLVKGRHGGHMPKADLPYPVTNEELEWLASRRPGSG